MALSNTHLRNTIVIDKKLLAINFDELALIESVLFTPKPINIIEIKKRFSIPLSKQQLIQDIKNPNSLFRKWMEAILMSEIARCLLIENESFRREIVQQQHNKKQQAINKIIDIEKSVSKKHRFSHKDKLLLLNKLLTDLNLSFSLKLCAALGDYLLEAGRANALKHYLGYAKTEKEAKVIFNLVEQRYQLAKNNFKKLKSLQEREDLTAEQKEYVDEVFERYAKRFSPENVEIMHRVHQHIDLDDPVVLEQYLKQQVVVEELFDVDVISFEPSPFLENEPIGNKQQNKTLKHVEKKPVTEDETKRKWKLKVLQDIINTELSNITDQHQDIITQGVEKILALQNSIHIAISNPSQENFNNIYADVSILRGTLGSNLSSLHLEQNLQQWCQNNANYVTPQNENVNSPNKINPSVDPQHYRELLITIEDAIQDDTNNDQIISQLREFYELCKNDLQLRNGKNIEESFNKIFSENPQLKCFEKLKNQLERFDFIDKDQLYEINSNPDFNMGF